MPDCVAKAINFLLVSPLCTVQPPSNYIEFHLQIWKKEKTFKKIAKNCKKFLQYFFHFFNIIIDDRTKFFRPTFGLNFAVIDRRRSQTVQFVQAPIDWNKTCKMKLIHNLKRNQRKKYFFKISIDKFTGAMELPVATVPLDSTKSA